MIRDEMTEFEINETFNVFFPGSGAGGTNFVRFLDDRIGRRTKESVLAGVILVLAHRVNQVEWCMQHPKSKLCRHFPWDQP